MPARHSILCGDLTVHISGNLLFYLDMEFASQVFLLLRIEAYTRGSMISLAQSGEYGGISEKEQFSKGT